MRRNISSVFVLVEDGDSRVLGYYTLAPAGIPYVNLQANEQKAMPRYSSLPAIRLGRLAVDIHFRNRKMGVFLLLDAMRYALNLPIAWRFFIVDAKESAVAFYKKFAFIPCLDDDKLLYLSRQDVENFCAV
ncbi:MAG: GNAT family N-acetyltransferase [Synergistaceae bacterium]|nr:GNAT family N-acetyltransferase [Synergistaceae bacterium]